MSPVIAQKVALSVSATLVVLRAYGEAIAGTGSVNVCRLHCRYLQRQRLNWSLIVISLPWTGRSWRLRYDQPCRLLLWCWQSGHVPEDGPQADTTQSPSSLNTTLCTLTPGPGEHFDLVRMPAHSAVITNDLLTTQSEEDPV